MTTLSLAASTPSYYERHEDGQNFRHEVKQQAAHQQQAAL